MPAGTLLTVLANIPWGQVVENAPKVAEGAARLWSAVTRLRRQGDSPRERPRAARDARSQIDALRSQVGDLEATLRGLEEQMQASSELIKALADQNTALVQRVEVDRVRLFRLSLATATGGVVLIAVIAILVAGGTFAPAIAALGSI